MPERRCAACGRRAEKSAFLRVVRFPDGTLAVDETGKANGRGAHLCRDGACIERAMKRQSLQRSFRGPVPLEIYTQLAALAHES